MNWINIYGLIFMVVIMIPNIIFAISNKDGFQNLWSNKLVETLEQIGRFSCFGLMVLIIPSLLFLISGVLSYYWPLIVASIIFAPCHITISYKNAVMEAKR